VEAPQEPRGHHHRARLRLRGMERKAPRLRRRELPQMGARRQGEVRQSRHEARLRRVRLTPVPSPGQVPPEALTAVQVLLRRAVRVRRAGQRRVRRGRVRAPGLPQGAPLHQPEA